MCQPKSVQSGLGFSIANAVQDERDPQMTFKPEKRIPPVIWTIVADRSRARILSASWPGIDDWNEVASVDYEEGALHGRDVTTDGPGTFAEKFGGHHGGEHDTDLRHQTAEQLSAKLITQLESGRSKAEFGKLAIVAPPLLLGVLRKKLPSPLKEMVVLDVNKDYTNATLEDVVSHLTPELSKCAGECSQ